MSTRRNILTALSAAALTAALPAQAQQQARVRRIGMLSGANPAVYAPWLAAFHRGMAALRWAEGRDYVLDARFGNTEPKALAGLVADFAASQPEVVLLVGEVYLPALVQTMKSVPIVLSFGTDPVGLGFAKSLRRPGGNVTGLTGLSTELGAKRLELLKEAFPRISHVALLAGAIPQVKSIEDAAAHLKLRLTTMPLRQAADVEPAFKRAAALGVNAYIVTSGPVINVAGSAIVEGIARARMPAIFAMTENVEAGGLMSYSASIVDNFRRAAAYVDKILKGAKPGDLPIEQPTKFEMVVNMKAAKAMGFTIPQTILLRADRLIE